MKEKPTIFRVIDKHTARMLANVLMGCYRRGVVDCREHCDDEGMLREHCAMTRSGEKYGFIGCTAKNPVVWRNRLGEVAEECGYIHTWNTYCDRLGRPWINYLSVMLVLAQEMYCRGIEDYLNNPAGDLTKFLEGSVRTLWTAKGAKGIDKYKLRTIVQDYCALKVERMEDESSVFSLESSDNDRVIKEPLKQSHYTLFGTSFAFAVVAK